MNRQAADELHDLLEEIEATLATEAHAVPGRTPLAHARAVIEDARRMIAPYIRRA